MKRKNKRTFLTLGIVVILLIGFFTPSIQSVLGKNDKPKKPKKKAREINVLLEYIDNGHFASDTPIEGVAWTMYDGLGGVITSGITDATGMITFVVLLAYDQSGNGIHIEYKNSFRIFIKIMWQGTLISINNLVIGGALQTEEYISFNLSPTFLWEDLSNLPMGTVVDFYFGGLFFDSATINSAGQLDIVRVIAGTYTLESVFFTGLEMVVLVDQPTMQLSETFIISAQFKLVSSFWYKILGVFYFFTLILSFETLDSWIFVFW